MEELVAKNLFMMCEALNPAALTELSDAYLARTCRRDELEIWKRMHFDSPQAGDKFHDFVTEYFDEVYASQAREFFQRCLFVCDHNDTPIATGFGWKAYGRVSTVHWFNVLTRYEGLGIGRALLSIVMRSDGSVYVCVAVLKVLGLLGNVPKRLIPIRVITAGGE